MGFEEQKILDLAARVSDGKEIDWKEVERSASSDEERAMVRHLRLVSSLAEVHRSQPGEGEGKKVGATATMSSSVAGEMMDLESPAVGSWGRLDLLEKLGEGAYGEVFLAWDRTLERRVALKLLRAGHASCDNVASSVMDEGRLLARVDHPNVVTVHGAEEHDGRVGIWMEYVKGHTLDDLLEEQGSLNEREAAMIGADLCRALAAVHGAGLIHRDIKSQNVMRAEGGRILLMDFGAGRDLARDDEPEGKITGTAMYMAPEVLRGEAATARSDIYSLGVLLYHLATGAFPIEAKSFKELRDKHQRREARLLRDQRPDLPESFVRVVEKALAWDPAERYASAGEMERALRSVLGSEALGSAAEESSSRKMRIAIMAAAAVVVVGVGAVWLLTREARRVVLPMMTKPVAQETPAAAASAYNVEAALYRVRPDGRRERLSQGARLAIGDAISLEFEASQDVYLYVINEDEAGHAYALFPLPDIAPKNPLPAGTSHTIPEKISWRVDTPGGREHLLVLASPERLIEFEAEMNKLARPRLDGRPVQAVGLSEQARVHLRGIGGLVDTPEEVPTGSAQRLFEMAGRLASDREVVEGVWLRQIELENPAP